ncbi:hypothetical protein [Cognatiyoonia sp. IB215182]|uniref:hypothetical protein n=1 Tax=Cognatiyoonia sp. IB215182 TaxID=3097353 RepID=UPI002A137E30|nr:hypothetical protein [Cognatiyoonia sp. IB215182]MDX8355538.1 hypothetical protein [Cognatiyoonia sp. IB215182]
MSGNNGDNNSDDDTPAMNAFWELVEALGKTRVTILKDGQPTEASIESAVLQRLAASALNGSVQSIRQFNELQRMAAENKQRDINSSVTQWRAIRLAQRERFTNHIKKHGCEPLDFPHPDDIWIDDRTGVRIRGPLDYDDYIAMRHTQRIIDACLWQDALERRMNGLHREDDPPSGGLLLAELLNQTLPRREQLRGGDIVFRMMRREALSKRQLLTKARQAWLDAGYIIKRGATLRSSCYILRILRMIPDAKRICDTDDLDEEEQLLALQAMIRQRMASATE